MHDHDHTEPTTDDGRLLRSGVSIKATADRLVTREADDIDIVDFVEVNVSVTSAHPARINLNAAAVAVDAALRAQLDEPKVSHSA